MCEYLNNGNCKIQKEKCPFTYWCSKLNIYKYLKDGDNCNVKRKYVIPKGYYEVCFERHGDLYIEVQDKTIVLKNIFEETPKYVKLKKSNGEYKLIGKLGGK